MEGLPVDIGNIHEDEYSLPALEISDAMELYGFALKSDDGNARIDSTELEYLFRFSKLVKSIPAAAAILEEAQELDWTLEHFMTNIYTHTRNVNAALSRLVLRESGPFAELDALASGLDADELAVLVALGMYWHEGPYIKSFTHKLTETFICSDQAAIIRVLKLLLKEGYLTIDHTPPARISKIHPLFTVYSRSKAHVLKATGRCIAAADMALAVFDYFVHNDGDDRVRYFDRRWFLNDIDQQSVFTRGLRGQQRDGHERSLQNTATALLLCCEVEDLPVKDWPAEHFMNFTMHLAGTAHAVESAYLTSKYDTLVWRVKMDIIAQAPQAPSPRDVRILLAFNVFLILARNYTAKPDPGSKTLDRYTDHFETTALLYRSVCGEDQMLLQAKTQVYLVARKWDEAEKAMLGLEKLGNEGPSQPSAGELRDSIRDALDKDGNFGGAADSTDDIRQKILALEGTQISPEQLVLMKRALKAARMVGEAKNDPTGALATTLGGEEFVEMIRTMKGKPRLFGDKSIHAVAQTLTDESSAQELLDRIKDPSFRLTQLENASDTLNWAETHETHLRMEVDSFLGGQWLEAVEHHKAAMDSLGSRPIENRKKLEAGGKILESALDLLDFERFSKVKTAEAAKELYRQKINEYEKYATEMGASEEDKRTVRLGLQSEIDTLEREPESAAVYFDPERRSAAETDLKKILPYVMSPEGRTEGAKDANRSRELLATMRLKPNTEESVKAAFEMEELCKTSKVAQFLCPLHKDLGTRMKVLLDAKRVSEGAENVNGPEDIFKLLAATADLRAGLESLGDTPDDPEFDQLRSMAQNQEAVCLFALARMRSLETDWATAIDTYNLLLRKYADGSFKDIKGIVWDFKVGTAAYEQLVAKAVLAGDNQQWREVMQYCDQYVDGKTLGLKEKLDQMKAVRATALVFANS